MYVIIDWHLSAAIANQAEAQSFFASVSKKYANVPNVLYETFNEPTNGYSDWATIKAFHEVMIKVKYIFMNTFLPRFIPHEAVVQNSEKIINIFTKSILL
jgi:hypothetical protein